MWAIKCDLRPLRMCLIKNYVHFCIQSAMPTLFLITRLQFTANAVFLAYVEVFNNIGGLWQVKEMATYTDTVIEERKESVVDISGDLQEFIKRVAAEVEESSTTVYTSPQIPLPKINVGDPAYVKAVKYWKRKVYKTKIADLSARDVERANFVFSIYDFEGNGTVDAVNLGDMLRALNLNPTLAIIEKLGGTKKKNEKKMKVDEFLPIYSQVKKDKEQGNFDDFLEALKLYDKEENGTMMAAELAHTLLSLGERLSDVETEQVIADCLDKEDDEGFVPYEPFLKKMMA